MSGLVILNWGKMFKKVQGGSEDDIKEIATDVFSNIIYLIGIAIIELVLRPMFGDSGVPFIPNIVLIVGELALCVKLLHRLFILVDSFMRDIAESWIITTAKRRLFRTIPEHNELSNQISQGGNDLAEYKG